MKNRINILAAIAIVALFGLQLQTNAVTDTPTMEIMNKASMPITVEITYTPQNGSQKTFSINIDGKSISQRIGSQINDIPNNVSLNDTINRIIIKAKATGAKLAEYTIANQAKGKTKYLTWNPAKTPSFYPQTGPLMGFTGKTESGLSFKKATNVSPSEINKMQVQ